MNDFEKWWYEIGSGIGALPNHDFEEHGMRISKLAWVAANKQICNERDEARFMFCHLAANLYRRSAKRTVQNVADVLGWDCYKTETQEETK